MSGVNIKFIGLTGYKKQMTKAPGRLQGNISELLGQAAAIVAGSAQRDQMGGSRTRALRRGGTVTAKSNQLGIDTGRLRQSINWDVRVIGGNQRSTSGKAGEWIAEVGTNVIYARTHELGRGAIPARPFMEPALKDTERKVIKLLGRSFKRVVR